MIYRNANCNSKNSFVGSCFFSFQSLANSLRVCGVAATAVASHSETLAVPSDKVVRVIGLISTPINTLYCGYFLGIYIYHPLLKGLQHGEPTAGRGPFISQHFPYITHKGSIVSIYILSTYYICFGILQ